MQNFANQCLDMARAILSRNLEAINEDGSVTAMEGEAARPDESGHAAHAIGEFYRATGEGYLGNYDLIDLTARAITAQAFGPESENGLAYSAMGLLSFGVSKDRNPVWERLLDETREHLDRGLLARSDYDNHFQAFNIAKSVARFSVGLSKKDETGKLIDRFIERIQQHSTGGYCDDHPTGLGGQFDIYGVMNFVFIRQALQLHANIHLRERKLPSLRTYAEKVLRMLPDLVRQDGLGWDFGRSVGAYGQMHLISLIMQSMRDGWISEEQKPQYLDILRRLFQFFFVTYLDQENGVLMIRDAERDTSENHTSRMANFDGARYLCQWARLAKTIGGDMAQAKYVPARTAGRWIIFDSRIKKDQGLFIYQDNTSGLHVNIPLISGGDYHTSDSLAFPHAPGIFDWPVNQYLPCYLPELTINGKAFIPAFYGKRCVSGLGIRNSFFLRYEQPELITCDEQIVNGVGSCKVNWTFCGGKITSEFIFQVKSQVQLDKMRYVMPIGAPHSHYRLPTTFSLGAESLRAAVIKDDFQAVWADTQVVANDPAYRGYWGNINYIQTLQRNHPLIMRPGQQYRLVVEFEPDIQFADE